MSTRTEYAVRYTEQAGAAPTIEWNAPDPTDLGRTEKLLAKVRAWQAKHGLPADAEPVTRTITTTDWQPAK